MIAVSRMLSLTLGLGAALVLALPLRAQVEVQEITSPGGVEAWLVEEDSLPFVALELRFLGGTSLDPDGQEGVTSLMAGLMGQGADDLDEQAYAEATEALAARFGFSASRDAVSVSARFLTDRQDEALSLLGAALRAPRFDEATLERARARIISGIRSDQRNPNALAGEVFARLAYGDHPYARPSDGTEESVAALSRDDLLVAHQRTVARDRVLVAAVGDISAEALGAAIDALLAGLPEATADLPPYAEVGLEGGVTVVPFDGPQSVIAFGHAGIARDDPDFFAAYLMNEVLGGGRFGTRLMRELRERRGLTYGVGSFLASQQFGDTLQGRFSTANDRVAEAIGIVREEWRRMAEEGISEAELSAIKTYLTGEYPLRFDGNSSIARILVGMQMQGLPADYILTRNDKVEAVTLDDVRAIAARLLDPEGLHFVVVGQPEGLEAEDG
ncbi:M16 family metallopeptidase [Alkalilacustris brevis]|uniref:M16 family metallopeptidase n=1 Tax=Alkalilacustris brevis TaxID=2026338 RepID=UPI001EE49283|nr:pitrilysin family protein [Alkalilacustris brevis]